MMMMIIIILAAYSDGESALIFFNYYQYFNLESTSLFVKKCYARRNEAKQMTTFGMHYVWTVTCPLTVTFSCSRSVSTRLVHKVGSRGVPSLKEPLSITLEWSTDHECFAMFDSLAHVLKFLICSFLRVSKQRPVSPS